MSITSRQEAIEGLKMTATMFRYSPKEDRLRDISELCTMDQITVESCLYAIAELEKMVKE